MYDGILVMLLYMLCWYMSFSYSMSLITNAFCLLVHGLCANVWEPLC